MEKMKGRKSMKYPQIFQNNGRAIMNTINSDGRLYLINKPFGWSSFKVIRYLRAVLKERKVGHAGSLDPMATGLLLVATGKKTKTLSHYCNLTKYYQGSFILGKTTQSYDAETAIENISEVKILKRKEIQEMADSFVGYINQVPPIYSAIKVGGVPAYKYARRGKKIKLTARKVKIEKFYISKVVLHRVSFEVICSKGTYIRSLVHDLGQKMKMGAHLTALVRTQIGSYKLSNAFSLIPMKLLPYSNG